MGQFSSIANPVTLADAPRSITLYISLHFSHNTTASGRFRMISDADQCTLCGWRCFISCYVWEYILVMSASLFLRISCLWCVPL